MPIHVGLRDAFPELPQFLHARAGWIAGDDGGVEGADRYAGDPIGNEAGLIERLVDAGLISAERAATLQDEGDAFERRATTHCLRSCVTRFCHAHPPTQPRR